MTNVRSFWDRAADKYAAQPVADQASYEHKLAETRKRLSPDMNLLEFGCGTGTTALIHAPHVASITAIDISNRMIEICEQKAHEQGISNVSFQTGTLDSFEAPDESFDAVLGMSILHLLPDHDEAVARAYRLLKPGGRFYSSTGCIKDGSFLIRLALPVMRAIGFAPFVAVFSAEELAEEMRAAGFEIELQWRPGPTKSVFIIARKPSPAA